MEWNKKGLTWPAINNSRVPGVFQGKNLRFRSVPGVVRGRVSKSR